MAKLGAFHNVILLLSLIKENEEDEGKRWKLANHVIAVFCYADKSFSIAEKETLTSTIATSSSSSSSDRQVC